MLAQRDVKQHDRRGRVEEVIGVPTSDEVPTDICAHPQVSASSGGMHRSDGAAGRYLVRPARLVAGLSKRSTIILSRFLSVTVKLVEC